MDEYDTRTATNNIDADSDTNDNLEVVHNMLSMLNDEQREIIERMYGIGTDVEESTDTIAMRMDITPNRVRRVANIAIKEMRKKSRNIAI
jgi:DNA-directed RNA polymerase sigma subunit (sigma70/sigma32)